MDELTARLEALTASLTSLEGSLEDLEIAVGEQIERLEEWNERRRRDIATTRAELGDLRSELLGEIDRVRRESQAPNRRGW